MIEANKYKLGIFVTVGMVLIILGIFIFGISQFFKEKINFYSIFTSSVEGLTIGSPVKYKGVSVGIVNNISICDNGNVAVYMELHVNTLDKEFRRNFQSIFGNTMEISKITDALINSGMRASLQLRGITGEKYIEIGFYPNTEKFDNLRIASEPEDICYIPAAPTYLPAFIDNVAKTLDTMANINLKDLTENLNKSLNSINNLSQDLDMFVKDFQTREVTTSFITTMNNLESMASSVSAVCNNIEADPSSVVWGNDSKPLLEGRK